MKTLIRDRTQLAAARRWDIDFHLPAEGILAYPAELLRRVDSVASISRDKRDPTSSPDNTFHYLDISSVEVAAGTVSNPQELVGHEAPSRARKVVRAFDILVSTCRPTRGAIAVVPERYHNQIASTGFSVVRPNDDINPHFLQYALRLPSTLEQFRKWSTGSSYPAILDEDVAKTLVPIPSPAEQDRIAALLVGALRQREVALFAANRSWRQTIGEVTAGLSGSVFRGEDSQDERVDWPVTIEEIRHALKLLPELEAD
jgi:type I restriction enzyme S subunit